MNSLPASDRATRLPVRFAIKSGESLMGYLLRLCEANVHGSPNWILKLCDVRYDKKRLAILDSCIPALSNLSGCPEKALIAASARSVSSHYIEALGSWKFPAKMVAPLRAKICPSCIEANGFILALWDLVFVRVCPVHCVYLVYSCERCGSELQWSRPELIKCRCGFDFRRSTRRPASEASKWLASLVYQMAGFGNSTPTHSHPDFKDETLGSLAESINLLSNIHKNKTLPTSIKLLPFSKLSGANLDVLFEAVAQTFYNWPSNLFAFLSALKADELTRYRSFNLSRYPSLKHFYISAYVENPKERYGLLRRGLRAFMVRDSNELSLTGRGQCKLYNDLRPEANFVTKSAAKKLLGISSDSFSTLFHSGVLTGVVVEEGSLRTYRVSRESVERYKHSRSQTLTKADLIDHLGVSRPFVEKLIWANAFEIVSGPNVDGSQRWRFSGDAVKAFYEKISRYQKRIFVPSKWLINFARLYVEAARHGVGGEKFIEAFSGGLFVPRKVLPQEASLNRFYFCFWEVRQKLAFLLGAAFDVKIPIDKASDFLGFRQDVLADLLDYLEPQLALEQLPIVEPELIKNRKVLLSKITELSSTYVSYDVLKERLARDGDLWRQFKKHSDSYWSTGEGTSRVFKVKELSGYLARSFKPENSDTEATNAG